MSYELISGFFGWIASILSIVFFILPAQIIWDLYNKKIEAQNISYLVFVATAINTFILTNYGIKQNLFQVWFCNIIGAPLSTIYILVFCLHIVNYDKQTSLVVTFSVLGSAILLNYYFYKYFSVAVLGFLSIISTTFMCTSPSQKLVSN